MTMTKANRRTYIVLALAGLLYNIYLVCHSSDNNSPNHPTQTEWKVFGLNFNF
ncbi:hypothetical protein ADICYQ_5606 [Cyclobacterium qasimii M12-11B]|uniref:Uncharacterized protein n=1 Tax=Cyclobacterium qasimii M12-11B TaxID=641524 RepID=S7V721_9BACT|nr:hypothetical protein ADICYQ_5606 [Cyclobacterium qasimii M12-11B]